MYGIKNVWIGMLVLALLVSSALAQRGGSDELLGGAATDESHVETHCETDRQGTICYFTIQDAGRENSREVGWCEYPAGKQGDEAMVCSKMSEGTNGGTDREGGGSGTDDIMGGGGEALSR